MKHMPKHHTEKTHTEKTNTEKTNTEKTNNKTMVQTDTVVLQAYCEEVTFLCSAQTANTRWACLNQWDIL